MDIILLEHIEKVGSKHDIVKVKDGYGRNFLIPRGLAIVANKVNKARLDGLKKQTDKKESAMVGTYREYAAKLAAKTLQIVAKAGDSGRLFGSVTAQNLVDTIREQVGLSLEKRIVEMPEEVKELGKYEAQVKFHPEVIATVKFDVVTEITGDAAIRAVQQPEPVVAAIVAEPVAEFVAEPVAEPVAEAVAETADEVTAETADEVTAETADEVTAETADEAADTETTTEEDSERKSD